MTDHPYRESCPCDECRVAYRRALGLEGPGSRRERNLADAERENEERCWLAGNYYGAP